MNEWLAVHSRFILDKELTIVDALISAVDFFNHLNMLYGTVTEFCTPSEV